MVRAVENDAEAEAPEADAPAPKAKAKAKPAKAKPAKAKAKTKPAKAPAKGKAKPAKAKAEPAGKDAFGLRKGSIKSQAAALYAGKKGATLLEVKDKVGSIQLNVLTELKEKGFKVTEKKETGDGKRQVTRYFLAAK